MRRFGDRFDHNLHALRIVEQFEQRYLDFPGLNLTFEVREGIIKHSCDYGRAKAFPELGEYLLDERPPLEAQLIDGVDEIAYNTADLDDGFEAHILELGALSAAVPIFAEAYAEVDRGRPQGREKLKFNEALKRVLDLFATDFIRQTQGRIEASGVASVEDVRGQAARLAGFSPPIAEQDAAMKRFLHAHLYDHPAIVAERERSVQALGELFGFFLEHPEKMPAYYVAQAEREPRHRVVCDYIAGMTDHFLLRQHGELLGSAA